MLRWYICILKYYIRKIPILIYDAENVCDDRWPKNKLKVHHYQPINSKRSDEQMTLTRYYDLLLKFLLQNNEFHALQSTWCEKN